MISALQEVVQGYKGLKASTRKKGLSTSKHRCQSSQRLPAAHQNHTLSFCKVRISKSSPTLYLQNVNLQDEIWELVLRQT